MIQYSNFPCYNNRMPQLQPNFSQTGKTVAVNTVSQIIARIISAVTTLIVTIVVARHLGVTGLGDFIKMTTFLAFFYLVADFGLNAMYLQRTPLPDAQSKQDDPVWEDLLMVRLLLSSALVLVAIAVLYLLPSGSNQGYTGIVRIGIILFAPSIVLQALISTGNAMFQKHLRYDLSAVALAAGSLVTLCVIPAVFLRADPSTGVIISVVSLLAGSAVTAATGLALTRRFSRIDHSRISLPSMKNLLIAAAPLGITLIFNVVYFRVDSIIITLTRSTAEVGIYGLAYKLFELVLVFPTFFMNALYPVMIGYRRNETDPMHKEFRTLINKSGMFLLLSSFICMIALWMAAPAVAIIRDDFAPGIGAARVLAAGLPFFFLSSLTMWILITGKKQKLLAVIYGASMVVNISLNIMYIPVYGYMAAAWITVLSEALVLAASGAAAIQYLRNNK
jgi:O-antigen/teichoic acid export membrane protein